MVCIFVIDLQMETHIAWFNSDVWLCESNFDIKNVIPVILSLSVL